MGNNLAICEVLREEEQSKESVHVNDGFFSLYRLFSLKSEDWRFSPLSKKEYLYHEPLPDFFADERASPPKVMLEVRRATGFPPGFEGLSGRVRVTFHPSARTFTSTPCVLPFPRWYYLAYVLNEQGQEASVVLEVLTQDYAIARAVIHLKDYEDSYSVFWVPATLYNGVGFPRLEVRLLNVVNPKSFWSTDSPNFQEAVKTIQRSRH